jgi:hypothetical protein
MGAAPTLLYARNELRRSWRSLLGLTLLIALAGAFVLTAATGARRVATAWTRFGDATQSPNLLLAVAADELDEAAHDLRSDPGVAGLTALTWLPIRPQGIGNLELGGFAGLLPDFGSAVYRPLVVEGRLPDQSRADEFTINPEMSKASGLRVGDRTTLVSEIPGVRLDATLVGITRGPIDTGANADRPAMLYTVALAQQFSEPIRNYIGDGFRPALVGRASDDALARLQSTMAERYPDAAYETGDVLGHDVRTALAVEERAYWILTAVAAAASILVIGQILMRSLRHRAADSKALQALGCTAAQRSITLTASMLMAIIAGNAIALGLTQFTSTLVPTGLAARIDPENGSWVDMRFALGGMAILALVPAASVLFGARLLSRPSKQPVYERAPSALITAASRSASSLLGARAAFGGPDTSTRRTARAGVAIVALSLASIVAVSVWVSSLDSLRSDPRLYGWDFDVAAQNPALPPREQAAAADALVQQLDTAAIADALERVDLSAVYINGTEIELMVLQPRRGSLHPPLLRGRRAVGPSEIVLGPAILRRIGANVGDEIEVSAITGSARYTLVGEAVYPLLANAGWGLAGSITSEAAQRLQLEPSASHVLVDLAPGRSIADIRAVADPAIAVREPSSPTVVGNLREAAPVLFVLALFVATLIAATMLHAIVSASHRRRRDHATARAMGLTGRQLTAAFGWHSETIALTAIVIALPLGVLIGAVAWRMSVRNLGVLDAFHVPAVTTLAIVIATLIVALLGAFAIAINARRAPLAASLRTE